MDSVSLPQPSLSLSSTTKALTSKHVNETPPLPPSKELQFPFLTLPFELRDPIYRFALIASPIRTSRYHHWFKPGFKPDVRKNRALPCLSLLLANRQIYGEASQVLYREGRFIIPGFLTQPMEPTLRFYKPSTDELSRFDLTALDEKWYQHIRHVEIEIGDYASKYPVPAYSWLGTVASSGWLLRQFPDLKTVTVSWQSYTKKLQIVTLPDFNVLTSHSSPIKGWWLVQKMWGIREFGQSHPGVEITVQRPPKNVRFTNLLRKQNAEVGLAEFVAKNEMKKKNSD